MKLPLPIEIAKVGEHALFGQMKLHEPRSCWQEPEKPTPLMMAIAEMIVFALAKSESLHHVERLDVTVGAVR